MPPWLPPMKNCVLFCGLLLSACTTPLIGQVAVNSAMKAGEHTGIPELDLCRFAKEEIHQGRMEAVLPVLEEVAVDVSGNAQHASRSSSVQAVNGALAVEAEDRMVLLARRTVVLCGWLANGNQLAKAETLARQVVGKLERRSKLKDKSWLECSYWHAVLLSEYCARKQDALTLVLAARVVDCEDERFMELECTLKAALAVVNK